MSIKSRFFWYFILAVKTSKTPLCQAFITNANLWSIPSDSRNGRIIATSHSDQQDIAFMSFLRADQPSSSPSFLPSFNSHIQKLKMATSLDPDSEVSIARPTPCIQRKYETFTWTPSPTSPYFNNNQSYKINYRVEGDVQGDPILLVHGFGANVNHFRNNIPYLANNGYRVYAIDLLGFGASEKPKDAKYSIELWVELLCDFIRSQQDNTRGKKWVVAGNSIGGLCSLGTTAQLPDLIRGCVLFNTAGGMTGIRYEELPFYLRPVLWFFQNVIYGDLIGSYVWENFKTRANVESILKNQGVYVDHTNVNDELLHILLEPSEDDGAKDVFLNVFRGPPGPTPESLLQVIQCPVLAIWGDSDPWTPYDRGLHPGSQFHKYAKGNFNLVVLDGVGHCPHDEDPTRANAAVAEFLSGLSKPEFTDST